MYPVGLYSVTSSKADESIKPLGVLENAGRHCVCLQWVFYII